MSPTDASPADGGHRPSLDEHADTVAAHPERRHPLVVDDATGPAASAPAIDVPCFVVRCGPGSLTVAPDAVELRIGASTLRLTADDALLCVGEDARLRIEGQVATLTVGSQSIRIGPGEVSVNDGALEVI